MILRYDEIDVSPWTSTPTTTTGMSDGGALALTCPHCADGLTVYASCSHSYGCSITGHDCQPKRTPSAATKPKRRRRRTASTPPPIGPDGEPVY